MDNLFHNQKINKEMSGSKRRSRLNLGIATLPNSGCFTGQNGSLGIIEMVCSLERQIGNDAAFGTSQAKNVEIVQTEKFVTLGSSAMPELLQPSLNSQFQLSEVLGTDKDRRRVLVYIHNTEREPHT